MEKLKDICRFLDKHHVKYERSENNQQILIKSCEIGDNFYDYEYGERPKAVIFDPPFAHLKNDPRIIIIICENCWECAGW